MCGTCPILIGLINTVVGDMLLVDKHGLCNYTPDRTIIVVNVPQRLLFCLI